MYPKEALGGQVVCLVTQAGHSAFPTRDVRFIGCLCEINALLAASLLQQLSVLTPISYHKASIVINSSFNIGSHGFS